jgi:hypothetical protein
MPNSTLLPCDGCGQLATAEHISRRLQRLEWASRYRPIHIQTLLLGGISSRPDDEFLYSPEAEVRGEAYAILQAVGISTEGKSKETLLTEFQRLGLLLTHVLECPLDSQACSSESHALIANHLASAVARVRRSLKPKRVLLLSGHLQRWVDQLQQSNLGCPVFPANEGTFLASSHPGEAELHAFRTALAGAHV